MTHPEHPLWQQIAGLVNRTNFRLDIRWNGDEHCFIATAYPEWDKENAFRLGVFTLDGGMNTILDSRVERLAARTDQQLLRRRPNSETVAPGQNIEQFELLLEKYADALKGINQWISPGSSPSMLPWPSVVLDDVVLANFRKGHGDRYIAPTFMAQPRAYIIEPVSGSMILAIPGSDDSLLDFEILEEIASAALLGMESDVQCFVLQDDQVVNAAVNFRWLGDVPTSLRDVNDIEDLCDLFGDQADVAEDESGVNIGVGLYGDDGDDEDEEDVVMLTPFLSAGELIAYISSDAGRSVINRIAKEQFGEEWDADNMGWTWSDEDVPDIDEDVPDIDFEALRQTMQRAAGVGRKLIEAQLFSTPGLQNAVALLERNFGVVEIPPGIDPEWLAFTVMQIARLADEIENDDQATQPPLAV